METKLCPCGHAMRSRGKQTLEMNGSSLGSNLWTDHVEVELFVCHWCGRMAFFEPEEPRLERVRNRCSRLYPDELREFLTEDRPESELAIAREYLAAMEEEAQRQEQKEQRCRAREEEKRRKDERGRGKKGFLSGLFGGDNEDEPKPGGIKPPEF